MILNRHRESVRRNCRAANTLFSMRGTGVGFGRRLADTEFEDISPQFMVNLAIRLAPVSTICCGQASAFCQRYRSNRRSHPADPAVEVHEKPIQTAWRAEKASFEQEATYNLAKPQPLVHSRQASTHIDRAPNAIGCANRSQPDSQIW